MKKALSLAAAAALLVSGSAMADATYDLSINPSNWAGGFFSLIGEGDGTLTGVDYDNVVLDSVNGGIGFTYSNDLAILITDTDDLGTATLLLQVGGYSNFGATEYLVPVSGASAAPGTITDELVDVTDIDITGLYVWIGNGYGSGSDTLWESGNIVFEGVNSIPAPGALALLGLAGLVSRRRR